VLFRSRINLSYIQLLERINFFIFVVSIFIWDEIGLW
jgi:hypothetical protein